MKFRIKQTKREGKVALWVNMPSPVKGDPNADYNIWDIPEEHATDGVLLAVAYAFKMGMRAQAILITQGCEDHTVTWKAGTKK